MAKSPVRQDESDSLEQSDSDDTSAMDELRYMIRRPDWLEVFKKQCEEQETEKSQKQSPERPLDVSLSDNECTYVVPTKSTKNALKQRQKRNKNNTSPERPLDVSLSDNECTYVVPTKSTKNAPKQRQKRNKNNTRHHAFGGRTRHTRRCVQRNASQVVDPEIVFLSDDEPSTYGASNNATSGILVNSASSSVLDDSIEVIHDNRKTVNGKEIDFENREINILFCWQNKVLTLPMKQDAQFGEVLPVLLNKWEAHGANVMMLNQGKIIKVVDTPSDHEMFSGSIVECSVVKSKASLDVSDPNVITIKLQMKNSRQKKQIVVNQMSQFQSIIETFAKEEGVPAKKVTFRFDGDTISHTDTPFGLGIENDFSIDVTY